MACINTKDVYKINLSFRPLCVSISDQVKSFLFLLGLWLQSKFQRDYEC
jgi:hypothetical protein